MIQLTSESRLGHAPLQRGLLDFFSAVAAVDYACREG